MSDAWTVLRLLTWTADYLKAHGSDSPRLDAEVLLAHARGCERIMLYTAFDQVVDDTVRANFRELVKRRAEGVPVAYLVGRREFFSLSFRVTPDVLIPRPETEFIVLAALDAIKEQIQNPKSKIQNPPLVADIGAGSGCMAVAIAKHAPAARLTAIDISAAALAIARDNAATHGVADRIQFLTGDLLAPLPAEPRFTVIASNPPYIGESEIPTLPHGIIQHEPRQALIAGPTGTEIITRLIPQAADRLLPGGYLILEISPLIVEAVFALLANHGQFDAPTVIKDLAGLPRVLKARRLT